MPPLGDQSAMRVTVRLDPGDAGGLRALSASMRCSLSEAMRRCLRDARPVVVSTGDSDAIRECNRLLAKAGGNLNQVARQLNSGIMKATEPDDVALALDAVGRVSEAVSEARSELVALRAREGARVEEALADDRA